MTNLVAIVDDNDIVTNVVEPNEDGTLPAGGVLCDYYPLIGYTLAHALSENKERLALEFRASLLVGSDWTQLPDSPLTDAEKTEWATYRQALRDITDQADYPDTINWPDAP